ncbi:hypothetical protein [Streptomyces sp. NPDC058268]|uniref:hypothetical protein n=1 Tax=Streptomyces sp. NPDC058268 TaxID=3346413 RepID=UPI0036EC6291
MSTLLWNVQNWEYTLGAYTNLTAAQAHGEHVIRAHYRHSMDRHRVPASHRTVDWRVPCCGHLYGPGQLNHTSWPKEHADRCRAQKPPRLSLHPFWAASGTRASTGHVSTAWEIWQGVAHDRFDPTMAT